MSRTWCPAIDADASSLAVVVAAQPKSRRAASPSRDASHAAANVSVSASAHAADVIVHNTLVQQFDGRVALSEFARQRMVIPPNDVDATTVALRGSFREAVPTQLLEARSLHAACTAAKQVHVQRKQKSVIGLVQTTVTTAEVQKLIDDGEACSAIDGIAFNGSVRGANTLQVFFEALNRDPEAYRKFVLAKEAAEAARLAREAKPPAEDDEDQAFEEEPADGESGPEPLPPIDLHLTTIQVAHAPTALSDNPTAAEELSKFVNATTTLKQLEIQRCSLQSSASLQALSTAILNNRSLTALDLSGNGVGRDEEAPASVEALAKLLQESKFLLDVSLRENDFSGPHCKALAEALANSDTRVPTPEPDPEPEAEPYTDDLGDPEEPPQVKIGFPEDEIPPEADPETAADEEKAEEVPAEAAEPTAADANGETEAEEEEEEEAAAASPPQAPAVAETPVEEDDEEDEEKAAERQRLLEEKEEAERVAREEAEAAWRERMETFIWGPERLHLEYAEYTARRAVMQLHVTETTTMKDEEKRQRADAKGRQLARQKLDRERRSGWSHLRSLDLSGNPVGSEGAIALASMLRTRIPLAVHHEDKGEAEEVEAAEPPPAAEEEEPAAPADDEDEENEKNVEEAAATAPADAPLPSTTAPAVKAPEPQFKLGMRTLKYINLNQCGIAAKGVVALANTIKDNADELRVLLLAKNKFALKHRVVQAVEEARESEAVEEEVDPDKPVPTRREVITDWASPAVAALSDCVAVNRALKVLDLSFNHLYPTAIRTLAKGLSGNQVLTTLRLDGNPIAHRNADGTLDHSGFDVLFEALATMRLANLGLAHTHLGAWLVESATGSAATKVLFGLTTLDLARNQITARALTVLNQAAASAEHCTLATLLLASNGFHHSDVQLATELSSLLKKLSRRLVTVDLSDNPNLGDNAIRSVAKEGLDDMPVLKRLLLRRTRLGPTTVVPLKKVIHSAMFLEELDFGDCLLDKESLESVMQSVCECTTLRRFTLWSRQLELGYAAATALLTKVPKLLLHVDLGLPQALGVEEPPEDTDEAYLVEDLEAVLLKNRQRASVPT